MSSRNILILFLVLSLAVNAWATFLILKPNNISAPEYASFSTKLVSPPTSSSALKDQDPDIPLWQRLPANDLPLLAQNLRRAGFPYFAIQAIIKRRADEERFAANALLGYSLTRVTYWQASPPTSPELIHQLQAIWADHEVNLIEALGDDYLHDTRRLRIKYPSAAHLSDEHLVAFDAVNRDYEAIRTNFTGPVRSLVKDSVAENILITKNRQNDIAEALGPDAYLEYQMRSSGLALMLREYELTESEYRQVFVAADAYFDAKNDPSLSINSPWFRNRKPEEAQEFANQLSASLSANRAADLRQYMDRSAQDENAFVRRIGQPISVATELVNYRNEAQGILKNSVSDRTDENLVRLRTIQTNLEKQFGFENLSAYSNHPAGRWLTEIEHTLTVDFQPAGSD